MKKFLCFLCMMIFLVAHATCHAESTVIPADDDDIRIILEENIPLLGFDYSCVTLNRKEGIFVINLAVDGLTANLLTLKEEGYDETFEDWVGIKAVMQYCHTSILDFFKTVHRDDLRLIINIVNDDAYIREDYSTITHNPLLTVGVFGTVIVDELEKREETFTVEHDEEYFQTRQYIFEFLESKGYEAQTFLGVPNIGRYEDENTDDMYVGWYAFVKHNGEWKEFVVLLFAGEVVSAMPNKAK